MAKLTLDEKRLEALRRQLQGKPHHTYEHTEVAKNTPKSADNINVNQTSTIEPVNYLKKDLTKILILSTLAIVFQLCLYLGTTTHVVNLHF